MGEELLEELQFLCSSSESEQVKEFGEGAHVAAAIASRQMSCGSIAIRYAFDEYDAFRDQLELFHGKICSHKGFHFSPSRKNDRGLFPAANTSTERIDDNDRLAHQRIRDAFEAVSRENSTAIRVFLRENGFVPDEKKKIAIWIRSKPDKESNFRNLNRCAFSAIIGVSSQQCGTHCDWR